MIHLTSTSIVNCNAAALLVYLPDIEVIVPDNAIVGGPLDAPSGSLQVRFTHKA